MNGLEDLSDVFWLAAAVLAAGPGEPPEARLAMAWVARNRREAADSLDGGCLAGAGRSPAGDLVRPGHGVGVAAGNEKRGDHLRALAIACQVLAGDLPDPTDGAVLLHRHDEQPGWATGRQPSALLGSHFFYRLDES